MTNVTLAIDDDLLKRARIKALEQGTSVNAVVRSFLETYAGAPDQQDALESFLELAERSETGTSTKERRHRSDLYDERTNWPRS